MRNNLKKLLLAGALVSATAQASEWRTPWISADGPIRYTFEKLHKDKYNLNWWSAVHAKEAHKAFLKHGTKAQPLTALIFNKADFTLNQIFPGSDVPLNVEEFNPFMAITPISPRVSYTEYGMTLGARWDYPVWKNKGRIGLRATVPFRRVEWERDDSGFDENEDPTSQFVKSKQIRVTRAADGTAPGVAQESDVVVTAYRMDLIERLRTTAGTSILTTGNNVFSILNNNIAAANATASPAALASGDIANVGFPKLFAYQVTNMVADALNANASTIGSNNVVAVAANGNNFLPDNTQLRFFDAGFNYINVLTDGASTFGANKSNLWLIFHRQTNSPDPLRFGAGVANQAGVGPTVATGIENILLQFRQNIFQFFAKNDFSFDTQIRSGMGDIDLDLFYEHTFNSDWMGELCVGVRFPTGGDKDKFGNPYKALLGNGEHFEVKVGALIAYQPWNWLNVKADAHYSFVLEGTEHRIAAFHGAQIKNIGPRADADVDWGYFVGHFDLNFFHPKTSAIRSTLGYEIYYKTEDHLTFKSQTMQSFLGALITAPGDPNSNLQPLSNALARKNTEAIAHKVRSETSFQINPYFEIFAGGSATFAGQNVMRDRDCHAGFNIRY